MTLSIEAICLLSLFGGIWLGAWGLALWERQRDKDIYFTITCRCGSRKKIEQAAGFHAAMEQASLFSLRHANCREEGK